MFDKLSNRRYILFVQSQNSVVKQLRDYLADRKVTRTAGAAKISRCYIYAFLKPGAYPRQRLGFREFAALGHILRISAEKIRADYLARGGELKQERRSA